MARQAPLKKASRPEVIFARAEEPWLELVGQWKKTCPSAGTVATCWEVVLEPGEVSNILNALILVGEM